MQNHRIETRSHPAVRTRPVVGVHGGRSATSVGDRPRGRLTAASMACAPTVGGARPPGGLDPGGSPTAGGASEAAMGEFDPGMESKRKGSRAGTSGCAMGEAPRNIRGRAGVLLPGPVSDLGPASPAGAHGEQKGGVARKAAMGERARERGSSTWLFFHGRRGRSRRMGKKGERRFR